MFACLYALSCLICDMRGMRGVIFEIVCNDLLFPLLLCSLVHLHRSIPSANERIIGVYHHAGQTYDERSNAPGSRTSLPFPIPLPSARSDVPSAVHYHFMFNAYIPYPPSCRWTRTYDASRTPRDDAQRYRLHRVRDQHGVW